jgi:hypothetical protein
MSAEDTGLREAVERYVEGLMTNSNPGGRARAQVQSDLRALLAEHQPTAREGLPVPPDRAADEDWQPPCRDCGPGYRVGDEGCRHDHSGVGREYEPEIGETGICRTCAQPIWWETGEVGHRERVGWSDRIKRGGDSLVCFKAVGYRHVPMGAREEAIYRAGVKAGKEADRE